MSDGLVQRPMLVLGATSAIAMATMRIYAARGAKFYLVARNAEKLAVVAADLRVRGAAEVYACAQDLDDTSRHAAILQDAHERLQGIGVAFIAHGVLGDQEAAQQEYPVAEKILRTDLLSPVSLITWLANYFVSRGSGTIVAISSVAGDRGRKTNYVYGTAKAGLSTFLQGVRNRVDRDGVNVITVKPGFVATPMTAHLRSGILFANPGAVANGIARGIDKHKDVVYVPGFWRAIMAVVKMVPESVFKRLNI
jgi:decaprenylphospho-beta-D-erythro-pentofuranosid-2-ulose 2-reductase